MFLYHSFLRRDNFQKHHYLSLLNRLFHHQQESPHLLQLVIKFAMPTNTAAWLTSPKSKSFEVKSAPHTYPGNRVNIQYIPAFWQNF